MLVAKQVSGGTEVVLGVQRDVEMGPVVMFGMGGVMVELFKDVSFAPATLDRDRAREMVRATRAGAMLEGFRGRKPGDIDALCDALVSLGRLARDLGDAIEAVDVNPLLVREQGVVALDALVVLRPAGRQTIGEERHDRALAHPRDWYLRRPVRVRAGVGAERRRLLQGQDHHRLHRLRRRRRLRPVRPHHRRHMPRHIPGNPTMLPVEHAGREQHAARQSSRQARAAGRHRVRRGQLRAGVRPPVRGRGIRRRSSPAPT